MPMCEILFKKVHQNVSFRYKKISKIFWGGGLTSTQTVTPGQLFLLKQLRERGMPFDQLHTVFQAIILTRLTYAIPVWGPS